METQPLADMLEDLLHEAGDDGLVACLAEASFEEGADLPAIRHEYERRYRRAVAAVCALRGEPTYESQVRDEAWPAWLDALRVAQWSDPQGTIYVALIEAEAGMRLVGGGRPHLTRPEAVTLSPPGGN